jgi:hypothetical protein
VCVSGCYNSVSRLNGMHVGTGLKQVPLSLSLSPSLSLSLSLSLRLPLSLSLSRFQMKRPQMKTASDTSERNGTNRNGLFHLRSPVNRLRLKRPFLFRCSLLKIRVNTDAAQRPNQKKIVFFDYILLSFYLIFFRPSYYYFSFFLFDFPSSVLLLFFFLSI